MDRRLFLRRTALALPALVVGDAALEAFERLTHRKVFALGGYDLSSAMTELYRKTNRDVMEAMRTLTEEWSWVEDDRVPKRLWTPRARKNEMRLTLVA